MIPHRPQLEAMVRTLEQRRAADDCDLDAKTAYNRAYYAKNKQKLNKNGREKWAQNKERYKVGARKWRLENREYCFVDFDFEHLCHQAKMRPTCFQISFYKSKNPFIVCTMFGDFPILFLQR